jgi:hypothetical protein
MVLVEATAHRGECGVRFDADAISGDEVGDALELGLVFGTRLITEMAKISYERIVGLEFRHSVEEDTLSVRFAVGVTVDVEAVTPVAHVLTVVPQRIDHLFPCDDPNDSDLRDRGFGALTIRDPGCLLDAPGHEVLEVFIEKLVKWSRAEAEINCEIMRTEEEE